MGVNNNHYNIVIRLSNYYLLPTLTQLNVMQFTTILFYNSNWSVCEEIINYTIKPDMVVHDS